MGDDLEANYMREIGSPAERTKNQSTSLIDNFHN